MEESDDGLVSESPYTAIDDAIFDAMNIDKQLRESVRCSAPEVPPLFTPSIDDLVSFALGCCFGRWSYGLDPLRPYRLLDPIPDEPPASRKQREECTVARDGMLVDDAGSSDDIVTCVQNAIERLTSSHQADAIATHVCHAAGASDLREYFRSPSNGGFWQAHLDRYSRKGRRRAPIYWLLQSAKKNYAVWLYYHRLDKDLLFKAIVNFVEPKMRLETSHLETLRSQKTTAGETGKEAKRLAKEMERQEDFLSELQDFEGKLRRAASLHLVPDLNDGVVLNIAPLHELVPWKEAKNYWDELLKGEYEWSSIGQQLRQKGLVK